MRMKSDYIVPIIKVRRHYASFRDEPLVKLNFKLFFFNFVVDLGVQCVIITHCTLEASLSSAYIATTSSISINRQIAIQFSVIYISSEKNSEKVPFQQDLLPIGLTFRRLDW